MSGIATAIVGGAVISAGAQYFAGKAASEAQSGAASAAMAERQRAYANMEQMMGPYMSAGKAALAKQQELSGAAGPDAQRAAIDAIQNSPAFAAASQQGERGITQNAAATGGLRGGDVQGALAQFRPQLLSSLINQQYAQLGGIAQMGAVASSGTAQQGFGNDQFILEQGRAQAAGALSTGQAIGTLGAGIGSGVGFGLAHGQTGQVSLADANAYNNMTPAQRGAKYGGGQF